MLAPWPARLAGGKLCHTVHPGPTQELIAMTTLLRRLSNAVASATQEDRPEFKRVDASPALYDDGAWLAQRR